MNTELVGEVLIIEIAEYHPQVLVGSDLLQGDLSACYFRNDIAKIMSGIPARAHQLIGGAEMMLSVRDHFNGDIGHVAQRDERLFTLGRPRHSIYALFERRA